MGITTDSLQRLQRLNLLGNKPVKIKMLELGCQNIYDWSFPNVANEGIAKHWFVQNHSIEHTSWDITGCQCAEKVDLRLPVDVSKVGQFDIITDYGTTEHIENTEIGGFYEGYKNIHNLCKVGGLMIHETPKTGHWIGHGFNYTTMNFFRQLAADMEYEIVELTEHFAMGNYTDGCLVVCVLRKTKDKEFIGKDFFNNYDLHNS